MNTRKGFRFTKYEAPDQTPFEKLFEIFQELVTHTSGDVEEALDWLRELDKEYELTDDDYTIDDFIEDLKSKGYIREEFDMDNPQGGEGEEGEENGGRGGNLSITAKLERMLRQRALDQIFGKIKRSGSGNHKTGKSGKGDEHTGEFREYRFGDSLEHISMTESLKNAQVNHGLDNFSLSEEDLVVEDTQHKAQMSTVLMIDISHSMILYGEDRITPAKKVAMALSEYITTRFPKDTLDIIVFGNDAWPIEIKDLPYLQVGPYHTNTVAGLELAMDILRRRRNPNKQIFMITDGKPTCLKRGKKYYKNSFGLDRKIVNRTLNLAARLRKLDVPVTTFMIAQDPYLVDFVDQFTKTNNGKAFYSSLQGLGEFIFRDYKNNKMRR